MDSYTLVVELIRNSDGKKIFVDGYGQDDASDENAMATMEQYLSKFARISQRRREQRNERKE